MKPAPSSEQVLFAEWAGIGSTVIQQPAGWCNDFISDKELSEGRRAELDMEPYRRQHFRLGGSTLLALISDTTVGHQVRINISPDDARWRTCMQKC